MADLLNNTKQKLAEGQSPLEQLTFDGPKPVVKTPKPIPQPQPQPQAQPQATQLPPQLPPQPLTPTPLSIPSEKIGINQITIPTAELVAPRSEQQQYERPNALTPQGISDTIVTPGIEARQAERDAFNQRQEALVNSITQQEFQPNLYEPPPLENTLAWGAQARSNIFQRAAAQDANNAALQIMARATQLENAGSTSDGLDWVRGILGQRDRDNERSYLAPVTFNKATQEYETNILGAVLYPLGVVQNLALGATLDVRQIMRHIGNAMPPWWRNFQSQWLQKNYPGIANSPMVQFVTKPNKYDDGKVNIIEALRGAQYSFSDDAGSGVGIGTQWKATKVDVPFSPGWKVPVNPTKLLGFGFDVSLGVKLDKLVNVGAKALGIGARAKEVIPEVAQAASRQSSRAALKAAAAETTQSTPQRVAQSYEQLALPLMQRPSAALPQVKRAADKLPPGFAKANKKLQRQEFERIKRASTPAGDQLSLGGEYDKLVADMRRQSAKRATPQDWRRYQYQRELPGKKFPTLSVLDPEVVTKRRSVPQRIIDASRPIPKVNPRVMQFVDTANASKRVSLADIGKRVSEEIAAEKAWAAEIAQRPQAYAEYITRRADGQLELPFNVAKTKPTPTPKAPAKGKTFAVGGERTRQLSMLNDLKRAVPGEAKPPKAPKAIEVVSTKTGKNISVPAKSIELYKRQQDLMKAGKQLEVLSETIDSIPVGVAAVDTTKRVQQVKQAVPKLPASPINDVVNAVAEGKAVKAVAAEVEEVAKQADAALDATQDIGRRLINSDKLDELMARTWPDVRVNPDDMPTRDLNNKVVTHGTRVENLVLENADPLQGSARHEFGVGHYFFLGDDVEATRKAMLATGKTSDNLPPLDSRTFGQPSLHVAELTGKALRPHFPSEKLSVAVQQLLPDYPEVASELRKGLYTKETQRAGLTLSEIIDRVSGMLPEEDALVIQRRIADMLRKSGISLLDGGRTVVAIDPSAIRTKAVEALETSTTIEEGLAMRNSLEELAVADSGSAFSKSTAADSAAQLSAQAKDSVQQSLKEAEQNIQAAVAKSGLLDDLPPVEPLNPGLLDIESLRHNAVSDAALKSKIASQGFSDRLPVVKIAQYPNVSNDFEWIYEVLENGDVAASWPYPRIPVHIKEVTERITPVSVGGDVEQYALDLLEGKLRPTNSKEFKDLVAGLLDDSLDLPSETIQRVVNLLEGKHTKLYDRVADAIFETKYADILPPAVAPVANKLDDLMKQAQKYGADIPDDLKAQIDELVGAIDDEAFERNFDQAIQDTKPNGGKTGEGDISPCGL